MNHYENTHYQRLAEFSIYNIQFTYVAKIDSTFMILASIIVQLVSTIIMATTN
jgi:hypothetical protein